MSNNKGYNNLDQWNKIQEQNLQTHIVKDDEVSYVDMDDEQIEDTLGNQEVQEASEDFSEVLQLTQYNDSLIKESNTDFVVAEYTDIDVIGLEAKHQVEAKKFVNRITKFVLEFNDVILSEDHKSYLKQVGLLQLQHLSDLLYLTDVNKKMLNNIIARVNATQAEDYAIINSYNNLANQHLKLIKELSNTYRSIPSVLKKMKADVLCNQDLEENNINEEVITSEFGETQYNNQKQLLRNILESNRKKQEENKN